MQIRLVGLDEDAARDTLLRGVERKRAKPSSAPPFPGGTTIKPPKSFPGAAVPSPTAPVVSPVSRLIPDLKRVPSDLDKRRFMTSGFDTIKQVFQGHLQQVEKDEARIQTEFQLATNLDFRAELYFDGKSKCRCRIWHDAVMRSDSINYAEGSAISGNAYNEIISLAEGAQLAFRALGISGHSAFDKEFNFAEMTAEEAANYLWSRFTRPLAY